MPTRPRQNGEFCWINMLTPQPEAARDFFSTVLGWTYEEVPEMGHLILVDGNRVGGLWDLANPGTPPGTPAHIGVMVKVASADAMVSRVKENGGQAQPPTDVMGNGRMVLCQDPTGAHFDLWEPRAQPGMEVMGTEHGAPSWFELITPEQHRAAKFYGAVFQWSIDEMPMPDMTYIVCKIGETNVGGIMERTAEMGDMSPFWGTYFTVNDVDEAVGRVEKGGGQVLMPAMDVPTVGRMAAVMSPQGVAFSVIKYEE